MSPPISNAAAIAAQDAWLSLQLLAIAPSLLGGLWLRAGPDPRRDALLLGLSAALPKNAPLLRVPLHAEAERLLGGMNLAATLQSGRLVREQGLLRRADGGLLLLSMAERWEPGRLLPLCQALDRQALPADGEGACESVPCRFGIVALDEGRDEEGLAGALADRLALFVDLQALPLRPPPWPDSDPRRLAQARHRLSSVQAGDEITQALCETALALGIGSLRISLLSCQVARVHAAFWGRDVVGEEDAEVAARLVLGPRAQALPAESSPPPSEPPAESAEPPPSAEDSPSAEPPPDTNRNLEEDSNQNLSVAERVLAAAQSAIPAGLLDRLRQGHLPRRPGSRLGQSGVLRSSALLGRIIGARPGRPEGGQRLQILPTLQAAAPWQRLRRQETPRSMSGPRVLLRREDFHMARRQQRSETCVIFVVDASGSAALQRLAEAKGAAERVLADCYIRRDHVALIAFRGREATLLLPPTRSLLRARRCLAALAGGGTTPLCLGLDAALGLSLASRQRGQSPVLVVMTDGRANIGKHGRSGRLLASQDAMSSARALRLARLPTLFLDTAPRPQPQAQRLASEMGASYLPMPYVDAARVSRQIQALVS